MGEMISVVGLFVGVVLLLIILRSVWNTPRTFEAYKLFRRFKQMYESGEVFGSCHVVQGYHTNVCTICEFGRLNTYLDPSTYSAYYKILGHDYDLKTMEISENAFRAYAIKVHNFIRDNRFD